MEKKKLYIIVAMILSLAVIVIAIMVFISAKKALPTNSTNNNSKVEQPKNPNLARFRQDTNLKLNEIILSGMLGYYYPDSQDLTNNSNVSLQNTITTSIGFTTNKPLKSLTLKDIKATPSYDNFQSAIFLWNHQKNSEFPDGIPQAQMWADGTIGYIDQASKLPNSNEIKLTLSDKAYEPDYLDEISKTNGTISFKIKLWGFSTISADQKSLNTEVLLKAANLTRDQLNTKVTATLFAEFEDSTTEEHYIDGEVLGSMYNVSSNTNIIKISEKF